MTSIIKKTKPLIPQEDVTQEEATMAGQEGHTTHHNTRVLSPISQNTIKDAQDVHNDSLGDNDVDEDCEECQGSCENIDTDYKVLRSEKKIPFASSTIQATGSRGLRRQNL